MSEKEKARLLIKILNDAPDGVYRDSLIRKLGAGSNSTFYRILSTAKNLGGARIDCSRKKYRLLECAGSPDDPFAPSDDDLIALVCLQQVLSSMTADTLKDLFNPIRRKIEKYLAKVNRKSAQWPDHIKILDIHFRKIGEGIFGEVLRAVTHKCAIHFTYTDSKGRVTRRTVSPQQVVRYRDNWYLDGWCHTGNGLRIFSLDGVAELRHANVKFHTVPAFRLKQIYATSYGLFSGTPTAMAGIRFTGIAARYIKREFWHPEQKIIKAPDGSVLMEIPFKKPQELIKEILSWGNMAEVTGPAELREAVAGKLKAAVAVYGSPHS